MCFAFVCFVVAALPAAEPRRALFLPLGLAFWAFVVILSYAGVVAR
jgi:hypothetical protein